MSRSWLLLLLAACTPEGGSSTTPNGLPDHVETLMRATYQQVDPTGGLSTTHSWTFGGGFSREGDGYVMTSGTFTGDLVTTENPTALTTQQCRSTITGTEGLVASYALIKVDGGYAFSAEASAAATATRTCTGEGPQVDGEATLDVVLALPTLGCDVVAGPIPFDDDDTTERISYASVVTCTEDGDEITLDSSATFFAAP